MYGSNPRLNNMADGAAWSSRSRVHTMDHVKDSRNWFVLMRHDFSI